MSKSFFFFSNGVQYRSYYHSLYVGGNATRITRTVLFGLAPHSRMSPRRPFRHPYIFNDAFLRRLRMSKRSVLVRVKLRSPTEVVVCYTILASCLSPFRRHKRRVRVNRHAEPMYIYDPHVFSKTRLDGLTSIEVIAPIYEIPRTQRRRTVRSRRRFNL